VACELESGLGAGIFTFIAPYQLFRLFAYQASMALGKCFYRLSFSISPPAPNW